jgi:hypothetical protein
MLTKGQEDVQHGRAASRSPDESSPRATGTTAVMSRTHAKTLPARPTHSFDSGSNSSNRPTGMETMTEPLVRFAQVLRTDNGRLCDKSQDILQDHGVTVTPQG